MNYKIYSLDNLKNWIHDALNCDDVSPEEILDAIKEIVNEQKDYHEFCLLKSKRLLQLISEGESTITFNNFDLGYHDNMNTNTSDYSFDSYNNFWYNGESSSDNIESMDAAGNYVPMTWTVPVEEKDDDMILTFPDDLLKKVGWKENDVLNWTDNGDGTFTLRKTETRTGLNSKS